MYVIIVGAGIIGSELTHRLIHKQHTVVLLEKEEEIARHAANRLDCRVESASGNDPKVLQSCGIHKADALIAVTDSDELNMIICGVAQSLAPKLLKIARVRNENYAASLNTAHERILGIDFLVHPDEEAALAILNAVEHGAVSDIIALENSAYQLICFTVIAHSELDGISLYQITKVIDQEIPFVVVCIEQNGKTTIPSGNTRLLAHMRISILTLPCHIEKFYRAGGVKIKRLKKIALIGMGKVGTRVASLLEEKNMPTNNSTQVPLFKNLFSTGKKILHPAAKPYKNITIIDKDNSLAKHAAEEYPHAQIYRGDVTDEAFIEEINLTSFDVVISATQNYELNMITSAYLKTLGIPKTIALVQSSIMSNVAYKMGIDVAVPFKDVTADTIMSHLGGKNVSSIHTMGAGNLEIVELTILYNSKAVGKNLEELGKLFRQEGLYGKFLVLLLTNRQICCIPRGNTLLNTGDRLTLIVESKQTSNITKYFAGEK